MPQTDQGRYTTRAQRRAEVLSLARIEISRRSNEANATVSSLVSPQHLAHRIALSKPTRQNRKKPMSVGRLPGLNARNGLHRPVTRIHSVEYRKPADPVRRRRHDDLCRGRANIVRNNRNALEGQRVQHLQYPTRLTGHVDGDAIRGIR